MRNWDLVAGHGIEQSLGETGVCVQSRSRRVVESSTVKCTKEEKAVATRAYVSVSSGGGTGKRRQGRQRCEPTLIMQNVREVPRTWNFF